MKIILVFSVSLLFLFLSLQASFADNNHDEPNITNSTLIINQYLGSIENNSTSQILLPVGNATLFPENPIEIGKTVKWMQVVTLNDTEDNIAIEIPEDAKILEITIEDDTQQIEIIDENQILTEESISLLDENETETIVENSVNSTAIIDNQESLLVKLESVEFPDEENTKLVLVSDENNVEQIQIEYETPAAYTIENESDGPDHYEKTVTVKSDSAIHYENVRSYSDIQEEYVLLGIPFTLDWIINGTTVNVIDDPRFDVTFEDTNDNGLVDQMSWIVPQLSEKTFSINADTAKTDDVPDVPLTLQQMQQKIETSFYDKTLQMINAKVSGTLDEYLDQSRDPDDIIPDDQYEQSEYYSVILLPNTIESINSQSDDVISYNQNMIVEDLITKHNAQNIYIGKQLSFVSANVLLSEIPKLSHNSS